MPFIVDNSVVCGWFIANQSTAYTEAIAQRLQDDSALAPGLWPLELANVLSTACMRGAMTAQRAQEIAAEIAALPISIDADPVSPGALLALALRFDLTSYDATYLELALRLQLPIATQDSALAQAAMAAGVGVVRQQ